MDKYTVDLDKVLNDFEYSELTDQNNGYSNNYSAQNQPHFSLNQKTYSDNPQSYPKAPNTTAKHSINNVFHSLNEYLNSDIKTDINNAGSSLSEINEIETSMPTLIQKSSDVSSIQEIFKSISKDENLTITNNLTSDENSVDKTVNNNFNLDDNILENKIDISETLKPELKFVNNNIDSKNLNTVELTNTKPDNLEISVENDETNLVDVQVIPEIKIISEDVEENLDENVKESTIVSLNEDNIEVTIIQPQPIKFGEVELSDTEMENELAELEQEYVDKMDNNQKISAEVEKQKDLKSELEEIISKNVIEDNIETDVNKIINESIETNSEEKNEESSQTIEHDNKLTSQTIEHQPETIDTMQTVDIEEQEKICDEENQNENNEKIIDLDQEKNETLIENKEIENEEKQKDEEPEEEVKIERRGSIRPSSLDLNSESTSENLTINLIGAPGSTPYNNLYSSLPTSSTPTLNPSDPQSAPTTDIEPEVSANSLSPTLSDASTYDNSNENSQSDSANTSDSCNDTSLDEHEIGSGDRSGERRSGSGDVAAGGDTVGNENGANIEASWLGKTAPFWTPDSDALCCLHCNQKFTVIKRRHHCRACGLVLCSKCCNMRCKLQYMDNAEARVCIKCCDILTKADATSSGGDIVEPETPGDSTGPPRRVLRPGNPMDYCSTVPPHQQVGATAQPPPAVLVPVGVLKRQGSAKSRSGKSVMFCDGIRPGCDLAELDRDFNYKGPDTATSTSAVETTSSTSTSTSTSSGSAKKQSTAVGRVNRNLPKVDPGTGSYIPKEAEQLPPVVNVVKSDIFYADCSNNNSIVEMLKNDTITFAIQRNFHVQVRVINMDCCINKQAWCFSTEGMIAVGQDEIVILLEFIDNEKYLPKDVFLHLNHIYNDAVKGTSIPEMGISIHPTSNFLESKNHAGFLFIKPTFQCIQNVILPKEPYLIGILIHRWETPWAKIFPLRLLLRLGAEYRYYPSPIISTRHRESVYVEIGHTIINLLADFRNFSYTIPSIRGLTIHMEDKNTVVSIPSNRYDQVMKALNNSSDHILAFAANFSPGADSHLVCIQDTQGNNENAYTTHAINIHNKPRKVTGASFIVLNGALKSTSGLTAKSSIVEDGLMIQIPAEHMQKLRTALRNMKDFRILCGPVNAASDESVALLWVENDVHFNVGVTSPIDGMALNGIPSIRVHNGRDFVCNSGNKMIRWTEVFIIQSGEEAVRTTAEPVDVSRVSEAISKATSQALVKYLDLLATNSQAKIAIRVTLSIENVSYLAGSNGTKLPPIYMKSLDNELIPVLHRISAGFSDGVTVALELMFHILNF